MACGYEKTRPNQKLFAIGFEIRAGFFVIPRSNLEVPESNLEISGGNLVCTIPPSNEKDLPGWSSKFLTALEANKTLLGLTTAELLEIGNLVSTYTGYISVCSKCVRR